MDPKDAVKVIVAAAALFGAEAHAQAPRPRAPQSAQPPSEANTEPGRPEGTGAPPAVNRGMIVIAAKYGLALRQVIERTASLQPAQALPGLRATAAEVREALEVLRTPAGRAEARRRNLSREHIGDVRSALTALDGHIKALEEAQKKAQ